MTAKGPALMRIGIHCLSTHPGYKGGTNSVTFGLLDGFARTVDGSHEFKVFVTPWNKHLFERYRTVPGFEVVEIEVPDRRLLRAIQRRLPSVLGRLLPLEAPEVLRRSWHAQIMEREADILYVPYVPPEDYFPFPSLPTVFSIHDIQQVHYPQFFTAEELRERELRFERTVEHATAVQVNSRAMGRDVCQYFEELSERNVEVIPAGVDSALFSRPPTEDLSARYQLPASYLLVAAQLWPHKNHLTILKALRRLAEGGLVLPVVLTGGEYNAAEEIFDFVRRSGLEEQVFYLGIVPFEDMIALLQAARLLVTASVYESSSLPTLEAAAAGTPIVASRIPAHEEIAEQLELRLFTPTDDEELARVLEEAWTDEETNAAQIASNRVRVQQYSWDAAARMYVRLFERIRAS